VRPEALSSEHKTPPLLQKIRLYVRALVEVPFYRYGEIGNLAYATGKNILDGVILYTMFSMAEEELKVAAILGIVVKYAYPGITIVTSTYVSGFVDRLESLNLLRTQTDRLIRGEVGVGIGQALGAVFLASCFPPLFRLLFHSLTIKPTLLVAIYLLHHICDGSAQIAEGRVWFKIIEIKIRRGESKLLAQNFWVVYTMAQNIQLVLGQVLLWGSLGLTTAFSPNLTVPVMIAVVAFGFTSVTVSKFILPVAYKLRICS
jgi:hypothetical protein